LIEPVLQKLSKQLIQWLTYASTRLDGAVVKSLSLVGPGASIPNLAQTLGARLTAETRRCEWLADAEIAIADGSGAIADSSQRSVEPFAALVAAARYWESLPDLMPPELRRQMRIRRIRKSVTLTSPIIAAGIAGVALL